MEQERITVLVADDHPMFRDSLTRAVRLDARTEMVAEVGDGQSALEAIERLKPDAAIIDLRMPRLDGIGLLKAAAARGLETKCILLSGLLDDQTVYGALEAGAAGVLTKTAMAAHLMDAVVRVSNGEVVLASDVQAGLASQIRSRRSPDREELTQREREILAGLAEGLPNADIAKGLFLSSSTVKSHLEKIYAKLGARDRGSAVAIGLRQGLIT